MSINKFESILLKEEQERLQNYAAHLMEPDTQRTLLLTAYLVSERLLSEMIETKLFYPSVWLDGADYRDKVNLARAMNLIGEDELRICRVLNSARNAVAHSLEPLSEKWRVEVFRLAFGHSKVENEVSEAEIWRKALVELIIYVAAPWLYAAFQSKHSALRKQHKNRWMELMAEQLQTVPDLNAVVDNATEHKRLAEEVDLLLVKELQDKSS